MKAPGPQSENPLVRQDPGLVGRLAALRDRVTDLLLDRIAAAALHDPTFRAGGPSHPPEDVRKAAAVLRVLTKRAWDRDDPAVLDACWRHVSRSDLFAEEVEAERHRITHAVEAGRQALAAKAGAAGGRGGRRR